MQEFNTIHNSFYIAELQVAIINPSLAIDRMTTLYKYMSYMNDTFMEPYVGKEVVQALSQIHPTKVPGLDGMPVLYFSTFLAHRGARRD